MKMPPVAKMSNLYSLTRVASRTRGVSTNIVDEVKKRLSPAVSLHPSRPSLVAFPKLGMFVRSKEIWEFESRHPRPTGLHKRGTAEVIGLSLPCANADKPYGFGSDSSSCSCSRQSTNSSVKPAARRGARWKISPLDFSGRRGQCR